jgi:hypothetical protein
MSNFNEKHMNMLMELGKKVGNDGKNEVPFLFTLNMDWDVAPAALYIKKNTKEYYYLSSHQYTVPPRENIEEILTDEGKVLYNQTQKQYERGEYKDVFHTYGIEYRTSGCWYCEEDSPFYSVDDCRGCLNARNNIVVTGRGGRIDDWITTSIIIFITPEWCLTKSGSLYKLCSEDNIFNISRMMRTEQKDKEQNDNE